METVETEVRVRLQEREEPEEMQEPVELGQWAE